MAYEEAAMALLPAVISPNLIPALPAAEEDSCHSSEFGYNGEGSTHGMIGIGAPTDTGSNQFSPDGAVEIDPHPTS